MSVGQESGLDECLETVADAQNQASAGKQVFDSAADFLLVEYGDDEFGRAIGFVTEGKSSGEHEYLGFIQVLYHLVDGVDNILFGEVTEDSHLDLCSGFTPSLGAVVVAVGAREDGDVHDRSFDGESRESRVEGRGSRVEG